MRHALYWVPAIAFFVEPELPICLTKAIGAVRHVAGSSAHEAREAPQPPRVLCGGYGTGVPGPRAQEADQVVREAGAEAHLLIAEAFGRTLQAIEVMLQGTDTRIEPAVVQAYRVVVGSGRSRQIHRLGHHEKVAVEDCVRAGLAKVQLAGVEAIYAGSQRPSEILRVLEHTLIPAILALAENAAVCAGGHGQLAAQAVSPMGVQRGELGHGALQDSGELSGQVIHRRLL
mmetsp:Transcript_126137/g.299535  ORF Transcript_126137/g.299535 Transcript_126137/m.299535 type:complete len:230 (+) Transcript_126137:78-767(+)